MPAKVVITIEEIPGPGISIDINSMPLPVSGMPMTPVQSFAMELYQAMQQAIAKRNAARGAANVVLANQGSC